MDYCRTQEMFETDQNLDLQQHDHHFKMSFVERQHSKDRVFSDVYLEFFGSVKRNMWCAVAAGVLVGDRVRDLDEKIKHVYF